MLLLNPNLPKTLSIVLPCITVTVLVAAIGHYQSAVAKAEVATNLAFAAIEADRHAAADAPKLATMRRQTFAQLRRYSMAATAPEAVADMLEQLQRLGKAYAVSVTGLDAGGPATPPEHAVAVPRLTGENVVLRLRGPFRGLLLFERRLSSNATLVSVDSIEFESEPAARRGAPVSSTVHAQLYYLVSGKDATP